jgi:hypothetical protein
MWRRYATAAYAVGVSLLFMTALLRDSKHVVYLDSLSNGLLPSERIRKHTEHPSTRHLEELVLDYRGCVVEIIPYFYYNRPISFVLSKCTQSQEYTTVAIEAPQANFSPRMQLYPRGTLCHFIASYTSHLH